MSAPETRRPGRPRKSALGQVQRVTCYVTPDVLADLEDVAREDGEPSPGIWTAKLVTKTIRKRRPR